MVNETPTQPDARLNSHCVFSVPVKFPLNAYIPGLQISLVSNGSTETLRGTVLQSNTGPIPEIQILFASSGQEHWILLSSYSVKAIMSPTPEMFYELFRALESSKIPPYILEEMKSFAKLNGFTLGQIDQPDEPPLVDEQEQPAESLNADFMYHLLELKRIGEQLSMNVSVTIV